MQIASRIDVRKLKEKLATLKEKELRLGFLLAIQGGVGEDMVFNTIIAYKEVKKVQKNLDKLLSDETKDNAEKLRVLITRWLDGLSVQFPPKFVKTLDKLKKARENLIELRGEVETFLVDKDVDLKRVCPFLYGD